MTSWAKLRLEVELRYQHIIITTYQQYENEKLDENSVRYSKRLD